MKIKFLNGDYGQSEVEFSSSAVTIGRDAGNQLQLDSDGVSRCHAEIVQRPNGEWIIRDLNSTNGVKVNGIKIPDEYHIAVDDIFEIGENKLQVVQLNPEPVKVIFNPIVSAPPPELYQQDGKHAQISFSSTPAESAPVAEQAVPAPEQNAAPGSDRIPAAIKDLKGFSGSIFSKSAKKKNTVSDDAAAPDDRKKKRSNMIFYTVLVCVVIMVMSTAFNVMSPKKSKRKIRRAEPLTLRYEKEIIGRNNIFRFEFSLKNKLVEELPDENDIPGSRKAPVSKLVYTAVFTIDDISSMRHFSKEVKIPEDMVEQLRMEIKNSRILRSDAMSTPRDKEQNRFLQIVLGSQIFETSIPGKFASSEFNAVEEAVVAIAENFNLQTIALTPAELFDQAEQNFLKAEDLFSNRSKLSNLRDAIIRYRAVVESLEQFSPKPKMWNQARKQLTAAENERKLKLEGYNNDYARLRQMRDFAAMKPIFLAIMELSEPDSREFERAQRRMVTVEDFLRKKRK